MRLIISRLNLCRLFTKYRALFQDIVLNSSEGPTASKQPMLLRILTTGPRSCDPSCTDCNVRCTLYPLNLCLIKYGLDINAYNFENCLIKLWVLLTWKNDHIFQIIYQIQISRVLLWIMYCHLCTDAFSPFQSNSPAETRPNFHSTPNKSSSGLLFL